MRKALALHVLAALAALAVSGSIGAAPPAQRQQVAQAPVEARKGDTPMAITYNAPLRGAPATRVGGGTRSAAATKSVQLSVLAPSDTGYTTRDKPTIYWYVSETLQKPVELTITSNESLEAASKPAFELTLQPPIARGVHALSLEQHGVVLKPGVEYQWFVALVGNAAQRSNDVIAGGTIKRVAETDAVRSRLKEAGAASRPALYAGAGIWYDAIDEISRLISAQPENRELRAQRAALLEQVGLTEAAAFDRTALR
jgi:Domain of Unknown Function (DUF928)